MTQNFFRHLKERGLIALVNDEAALEQLCEQGPVGEDGKRRAIYAGFDPTAKSLHIGHLVPLLLLRRAQDFGWTPVILFGGATGLIGDPTDRTDMRPMSTPAQIAEYIACFDKLIRRYFRYDVPNAPVIVNNLDWIGPMSWIEFAREVGVHFTVARLLQSDVNRRRFEAGGLTFMEMGYQLLQAYDFFHLFKTRNCVMQVGGNDQWSNVLAGTELIRRVAGERAFCFTLPLITDAAGNKLGKTSGNAVWIDGSLFAPYDFFQYLRNVPDSLVPQLFRALTFLPNEEIERLAASEDINRLKERLAHEVTSLVHGREEADKALEAAHALFGGGGDLASAPSTDIPENELQAGIEIADLLVRVGLCPSKGEARRLVTGNGLTVNEERVADPKRRITLADLNEKTGGVLLRKGKKEYHIVKVLTGA